MRDLAVLEQRLTLSGKSIFFNQCDEAQNS